jgi:site-specific DNA recombinase
MRKDLRSALYARVSSEQQAGDSTIASQLAALEARVSEDGLIVLPEHRFADDGYSGATLVRPALERLRDLAASGTLDRLYVHSPDRLARRYAYQVLLVDELHRAGVEVVFLNRQIGISPEDDLLLQVQGMVAEYERAKILERSRRGKRHAARQGSVNVFAGAPYGYRYLGKHDGGGAARYEMVEEQARVVRQVFHWVGRERASIGEVCRRLQGCPTSGGKLDWDRTTIWAMLRNPAYKGEAAFGKTRVGPRPARLRPVRGGSEQPRRAYGLYDTPAEERITVPVPRLVDPALFDAVSEQLAENRHRSRQSGRGARYLLQGLLVCRSCGYAYYGKAVSLCAAKGHRRDYAYYRCCGSDAYRFGGQRVCSNAQVRTDRLDEAVWREVERLLHDPARIAAEYERRLDEARRRGSDGPDLAAAEAQLGKLRRGMGRLIDSYAEGLIERAEFEPRIAGFRQRIGGWEAQIKTMRDEATLQSTLSLVIGRLEDFAKRVHDQMSKVDWLMQRDLIRTLVKRVEIDQDDVNVVFRIDPVLPPPDPISPGQNSLWQDCGRSDDRTLWRSHRAFCPFPLLHDPGLQPFGQQPEDTAIADPMLQEPHHPGVADAVEERPDVGVQNPVHFPQIDPVGERVQRIVLGTPRPEPIGEAEEVRLVDGVQHLHHRALDDLVLQRRDAERPLPAVGLRDVLPPRRLRPVCAAHHAAMQVVDVAIERHRILLPLHPIDTGCSLRLELMEGPGQQGRRHVVHQGREPFTTVPLCRFSYAGQRL